MSQSSRKYSTKELIYLIKIRSEMVKENRLKIILTIIKRLSYLAENQNKIQTVLNEINIKVLLCYKSKFLPAGIPGN